MFANRIKRPRTESPSKNTSENCIVCSKEATDDVFECYWCESRQHTACAKISPDRCNVLSNLVGNIVFFCSTCLENVPMAIQYFDEQVRVDLRLASVESKLSEVQSNEKKLSEAIKSIESQLGGYHEQIASAITNNLPSANSLDQSAHNLDATPPQIPTGISEESVVRLASSLAVEQREKEKRQLNIILHNLVEPTASEGANRKKEDIKKCCSLFQTYLGPQVSITNAVRLGKRADKPRLLKLTLSSNQEKSLILKNKMKLRSSNNPEYVRKLFITPDLTPGEQKQHKELRQQLADMNREGNVYMIKNAKIVRRPT